jgi:hypothetical protein
MAFSHLATRGTGALGRTVKTTRILGRYPDSAPPPGKTLKPSTVLAFASLPLGNVEMATDTMGLTAMLTPYLLVIVSTTPIAQTQHKSARPKEVAAHSALTGCLAWFPAVKLKVADPVTGSQISKTKLVYCWSNVLTVLDVDEIPAEDKDKPPSLKFRPRSRWKCEEPIVAVQWLSRSVLTVLTLSQQLIVLEDRSMRMTEAFDLINKHIYHVDRFSKQLSALVDQLDEEDPSMHGVVADAFYMSFKAYKGRLFLLGFNDVSIGALSNWADRLISLMENGDYVGAIKLATSYYTGDANKLTVGLPEDTDLRHSMVQDKLMEIMSASLKYAFGQRQKNRNSVDDSHLEELARTCFVGCLSVGQIEFLFDEMYEWFEDAGVEGVFLETLEPYILEESIIAVPPVVVKAMITHFVHNGWESRLEEMICHMDTATLDLDQVTVLCKQHHLYEALIYVWNRALNDFITPLFDLLSLLVPLTQNGQSSGSSMEAEMYSVNALKIFPYLSYVLTGRVYPTGDALPEDVAQKAKAELYWLFFSGKSVTWPKGSNKRFLTRPGLSQEPSFPYLRLILNFDAASFLSALNEAFEDSFLNDSPEKSANGGSGRDLPEEQVFGLTVDRQYIVSILMEIMNSSDFTPNETIYLDMFVARNLPKYPQYLLFPGSTLTKVLVGLCKYPGVDLAEDAQLSAEYLLSVYQPPDVTELIPLFKEAGFYRILKRIYRIEKQYGKLIQTYFEDPEDQEAVFNCIDVFLRPQAGLTQRQIQDVHRVIKEHSAEFVGLDPAMAAKVIARHAPELHHHVLDAVAEHRELQYAYLKTILEPEKDTAPSRSTDRDLVEQYLRLMCRFDPEHVSDYVGLVQSSNLRLEQLLPTMEEMGVVDAAVVVMAKDGQVQEAMGRLVRHLETLESALQGVLAGSQNKTRDMQESAEELLQALRKFVLVGVWLCQGQTKTARAASSGRRGQKAPPDGTLSADENLWLDLIDASVQITKRLSSSLQDLPRTNSLPSMNDDAGQHTPPLDVDKLLILLRSLVQTTFTALLTSTSTPPNLAPPSSTINAPTTAAAGAIGIGTNLTFLHILRAFLTRAAASSPNLADLRSVLSSIFSAYAYEESILRLSNRLLERSLFVSVAQAVELRQRGWRPRGSTCEACGRRVWGPGVQGAKIYEAWEERKALEEKRRLQRQGGKLVISAGRGGGGGNEGVGGAQEELEYTGKGKGKDLSTAVRQPQEEEAEEGGVGPEKGKQDPRDGVDDNGAASSRKTDQPALGSLVLLACRHIYHQSCLEALLAKDGHGKGTEYRCPIDG